MARHPVRVLRHPMQNLGLTRVELAKEIARNPGDRSLRLIMANMLVDFYSDNPQSEYHFASLRSKTGYWYAKHKTGLWSDPLMLIWQPIMAGGRHFKCHVGPVNSSDCQCKNSSNYLSCTTTQIGRLEARIARSGTRWKWVCSKCYLQGSR